jgi:hypothetical protein
LVQELVCDKQEQYAQYDSSVFQFNHFNDINANDHLS